MKITSSSLLALQMVLTGSTVARAEPVQEGLPLSAWIAMLRHPHPDQRERAIASLAALGAGAAPAAFPLADLLADAEDNLRRAASAALVKLGPTAVPSLLPALRDPRAHVRERAARTLGQLAGPQSIQALTEALQDNDPTIRLAAAEGLLKQGASPAPVATTLIALLEQQDHDIRRGTLRLLGQAGPDAAGAVPALCRLLRGKDRIASARVILEENIPALEALPWLGPKARAAIPALVEILTRPIPSNLGSSTLELMLDQRVNAAAALLAFGVERDKAWAALVESLDFRPTRPSNPQLPSEQRQHKILTLLVQGRLPAPGQPVVLPAGPEAFEESVLAALSRGLVSRDEFVRAGTLQVLSYCSNLPADWTPRLRQLADEDVATAVRRRAVALLARQGALLTRMDLEELIAGLEYPGGWQRRGRTNVWTYDWRSVVAPALVASAPGSVPYLIQALESGNGATKEGAADTLFRMARSDRAGARTAARQALPALKKLARQELPTDFINVGGFIRDWSGPWAALALYHLGTERQAILNFLLTAREILDSYQDGRLVVPRGHAFTSPERLAGALREVLVEMGDMVTTELAGSLKKPIPTWYAAVETLGELAESGKVPGALAALQEALDAPVERVRLEAVGVLRRLPEARFRAVVPALRRTLTHDSYRVRVQAALALSRLKEERDRVRAVLLQLLFADTAVSLPAFFAALMEIGIPAQLAPELLRLASRRPDDSLVLQAYYRAAAEPLGPLADLLEYPEQRAWVMGHLELLGPAVVPVLTPALAHANPEVRRAAVEVLRRLGLGGQGAAPRLRRLLRDPDPKVVLAAAAALCAMNRADDEVLPILLAALAGSDGEGRRLAAVSLGLLDERVIQTVPALRRALRDDEPTVRLAAAQALGRLGPTAGVALPDLVGLAAKEGDPSQRLALLQAADSMVRSEPNDSPAAVRAVLGLLDHSDQGVRNEAASILNRFPREQMAPLILPRLFDLLMLPGDPLFSFAENYVRSSGAAGASHLARLLDDFHPEVRRRAVQYLGNSSEERLSATLLVRALGDPDEGVRIAACEALHSQEKHMDIVLPALSRRLECASRSVRVAAAQTLLSLGARARPALPHLLAQAGDTDASLRAAIARALTRIGGMEIREAAALFTALVRDPIAEVREKAIEGLASLGPPGLPGLRAALDDKELMIRRQALSAVANLSSLPADLEPALSRLLRDPDPILRGEAAATLASLGPAAAPALPTLAALLRDADANVRIGAAQAIAAVGKPAGDLAPPLKALLRDPQEKVRRAAAEALDKVERVP